VVARAIISTAWKHSSLVITRGGANLIVESLVALVISPCYIKTLAKSFPSTYNPFLSSTPRNRPRPRTSLKSGELIFATSECKIGPKVAAFSIIPSSIRV